MMNDEEKTGRAEERKKQKPIEYPGILGYIIGMMYTRFSPPLIDAIETRRPL
jgi:hypothetical protein